MEDLRSLLGGSCFQLIMKVDEVVYPSCGSYLSNVMLLFFSYHVDVNVIDIGSCNRRLTSFYGFQESSRRKGS